MMIDCIENKIKLNMIIIVNLYVNHSIKRKTSNNFKTIKKGKIDKNNEIERILRRS